MSTGGRSGLLCNGDFLRAPRVNLVWAQAETGQKRPFAIDSQETVHEGRTAFRRASATGNFSA
jgi:hypothetical protein